MAGPAAVDVWPGPWPRGVRTARGDPPAVAPGGPPDRPPAGRWWDGPGFAVTAARVTQHELRLEIAPTTYGRAWAVRSRWAGPPGAASWLGVAAVLETADGQILWVRRGPTADDPGAWAPACAESAAPADGDKAGRLRLARTLCRGAEAEWGTRLVAWRWTAWIVDRATGVGTLAAWARSAEPAAALIARWRAGTPSEAWEARAVVAVPKDQEAAWRRTVGPWPPWAVAVAQAGWAGGGSA